MNKTCKHCLGTGKIIINAGTGLLAACVKCAAQSSMLPIKHWRRSARVRNPMNHNSSRLRWYLIRPFDTGMLGRLAKGMLEAKYEEDSGFGYILGDVRKSFITGRFVQRETVTRLILDPHGSERNFSFENYQSTSFVIRDLAPHLELRNPCRRLSELFTSIGDLLDNSVAITPIEAQGGNGGSSAG